MNCKSNILEYFITKDLKKNDCYHLTSKVGKTSNSLNMFDYYTMYTNGRAKRGWPIIIRRLTFSNFWLAYVMP